MNASFGFKINQNESRDYYSSILSFLQPHFPFYLHFLNFNFTFLHFRMYNRMKVLRVRISGISPYFM